MPNCESYQRMSLAEQIELIGKITHAVQNDEMSFQIATTLLNKAERRNIFSDVVINPAMELVTGSMPAY